MTVIIVALIALPATCRPQLRHVAGNARNTKQSKWVPSGRARSPRLWCGGWVAKARGLCSQVGSQIMPGRSGLLLSLLGKLLQLCG